MKVLQPGGLGESAANPSLTSVAGRYGSSCGKSRPTVESSSASESRFNTRKGEVATKNAAATHPAATADTGSRRRQPLAGDPITAAAYVGSRSSMPGYLVAMAAPVASPAMAPLRTVARRASGNIAASATTTQRESSTSVLTAWLSRACRKLVASSRPASSAGTCPSSRRVSRITSSTVSVPAPADRTRSIRRMVAGLSLSVVT